MSENKNKFYVTTPIYYVTARPHLGSLYSTILADVVARFHKIKGEETFMLTGTDEHGQKVAQAAEAAGLEPKKFVDGFIDSFKTTWRDYEIDYNHFIRTTDEYHVKAVQQWIKKLQEKGDIYKGTYKGWYCTPCETFVAEATPQDEGDIICPQCNRPTIAVEEEAYFFKLSAYQDKLLDFYKQHPNFITPKERTQEVIKFVEGGLRDLCLSRSTISWGIPFPGDKKQVTYVWADALNNYITAIGYGDAKRQEEFNKWWPADLHILGKDIVRFHAIYWPAFLMASGMPLPKRLLVHGWIQIGGKKMSKSFGNVIDPQELLKSYGPEVVRYYLVRHMAVTQDSPFTIEDLEEKANAELANDLGNLLQRMVSLALKFDVVRLAAPSVWSEPAQQLEKKSKIMLDEFQAYFNDGMFHLAYGVLWKFINEVNAYFHKQEPWLVAKTDKKYFEEILSAAAHSLYIIGYLLWPVMPKAMDELFSRIGKKIELDKDNIATLKNLAWKENFTLSAGPSLFKKFEVIKVEKKEEIKQEQPDYITIDDVIKVHLVVGTINVCEPVEKSEKLYRLEVDCGQYGTRQILAGARKYCAPEDLIGKQGVFILNLKPRKMAGIESQGMMLFAKDAEGNLIPSGVHSLVPNGTRLQ